MLLGLWKNVEELEMYITVNELELLLKEARDKEMRHHRFLAAIQGIDLDKQSVDNGEDRVEAAKRRIAAQQAGKSPIEAEYAEIELDYEVEE
jgi:hypothetical protein